MKVIVDGFGGDNAPVEVLKGCALAVQELDVDVIVTGDEQELKRTAEQNGVPLNRIQIVHAPGGVIGVEESPVRILKERKDCSMGVAFQMLAAGEGDAFLSAGSTGALVVGASHIVKRIKGIKRAALAPILPSDKGCYMLLDAGANLECRPEMLQQFGIMGSVYMNKIIHVKNPRVGLVNIGAEESKGGELQTGAYELLKQAPVHFTGNVEPRDLPLGGADVAVADGFTGNVVLKLTEGMGAAFNKNIKEMFFASAKTKFAAMLMMKQLKGFKKKMDYTEYGGAPLMGVTKPVIKAHGSSNANAFKNAIRQAKFVVENHMIEEITQSLAQLAAQKQESKE